MDKSLDEIIATKGSAGSASSPASGGSGASGVSKSRRSRGSRSGRSGRSGRPGGRQNLKAVFIRNLSSQITEKELQGLFREAGPVVSTVLDTDDRRKRTGLAWVLYKFAEDAAVAVGRFNGRRAAGQIISVRQVANVGSVGDVGVSLGERVGAPGRSSKPREKKRSGSARSAPRAAKSQEELDAELDAYMNDAEPAAGSAPVEAAPASHDPPAPQEDISI